MESAEIKSKGSATRPGDYFDSGTVAHGYSRATNGTITKFDAPGAGTGLDQGTYITGINMAGAITGYVSDSGSVFHGYVRP